MKKIFLFLIILTLSSGAVFSQKNKFPYGMILNLKTGYHFKDDKTSGMEMVNNKSIPGGFCFELSGEVPLGKGWYAGLSFDYLIGNDVVYEYYTNRQINRSFTITNYSLPVSKRFISEKTALVLQAGFGKTTIYERYSYYSGEPDGAISLKFSVGLDHSIAPQTLISLKGEYLGYAQIDFGGGGRANDIFMLKAGISYVINF